MNMNYPHDIVSEGILAKMFADAEKAPEKPEKSVFDYVMLTPQEAELLHPMSPEERSAWIDENLPSWERLARYLEREDAPTFLVERARAKVYSDFDSTLTAPCVALVRDAKRFGLHRVVAAAKSGAFDATKKESADWADRQSDPQVRKILDTLGLKP